MMCSLQSSTDSYHKLLVKFIAQLLLAFCYFVLFLFLAFIVFLLPLGEINMYIIMNIFRFSLQFFARST